MIECPFFFFNFRILDSLNLCSPSPFHHGCRLVNHATVLMVSSSMSGSVSPPHAHTQQQKNRWLLCIYTLYAIHGFVNFNFMCSTRFAMNRAIFVFFSIRYLSSTVQPVDDSFIFFFSIHARDKKEPLNVLRQTIWANEKSFKLNFRHNK